MKLLIDLHIHSNRSYDNVSRGPTVQQIFNKANELGLQVVAITDHNRTLPYKQYEAIANAYDLILIPGIEITCVDGHLIVLGVKEDPPMFQSVIEASEFYQDKDVVTILAHPYDPDYGLMVDVDKIQFDLVEYNGRRSKKVNQRAKELAERLKLSMVGSSDAHIPVDIGSKMTIIEVKEESLDAVLKELKAGRCEVY